MLVSPWLFLGSVAVETVGGVWFGRLNPSYANFVFAFMGVVQVRAHVGEVSRPWGTTCVACGVALCFHCFGVAICVALMCVRRLVRSACGVACVRSLGLLVAVYCVLVDRLPLAPELLFGVAGGVGGGGEVVVARRLIACTWLLHLAVDSVYMVAVNVNVNVNELRLGFSNTTCTLRALRVARCCPSWWLVRATFGCKWLTERQSKSCSGRGSV